MNDSQISDSQERGFRFPDLRSKPLISVFGGRKADDRTLKLAEAFGRLAAENGWIILNGGKNGVMEAVSRGMYKAGGLCIGLLPGEDLSEANSWLQIAVPTGIGLARNEILARAGKVCIAIGGHYGTLTEISYALSMEKPVLSLGSWEIEGVIRVDTAEDAAGKIREIIG